MMTMILWSFVPVNSGALLVWIPGRLLGLLVDPVLEPLEHLVLDVALDGGPMGGISVLEPLEHSVLDVALDGRPMEWLSVLEPLEHSVLDVALDGKPMKGISVLKPLEHSVLEVILDCVGISVMEPLEHSVPAVILDRGVRSDSAGGWGGHCCGCRRLGSALVSDGLGE